MDGDRECCNNELEQKLTLLHSEWSKRSSPRGKTQVTQHIIHWLIVSNPIDEKGSEFMHRNMRWEAPSMPEHAHDPRLLREQETPLVKERLASWTKRFQQVVSSESKTRRKYGKSGWTKRESSRRKV